MARKHVNKQKMSAKRVLKPMLIGCAVFYLCFHVFHGERGLVALWREQHEHARLVTELAEVTQARIALERRVSGLRADSLDRDLLDEQLRRMLGMRGVNEFVVLGK